MAIQDVADAESALADDLCTTGERLAVEHDIYQLTRTLARLCAHQVRRLTPLAVEYGADVHEPDPDEPGGLRHAVRRVAGRTIGRSEAAGLLLLAELRELYLATQRAEIAWTILLQAAKAARGPRLIEAATAGQEHAETRAKWLRTRIKEAAPQAIVAG